jgi:hypothetical protein
MGYLCFITWKRLWKQLRLAILSAFVSMAGNFSSGGVQKSSIPMKTLQDAYKDL